MARDIFAPTTPPPPFRAPASRLMRFLRPRLYGSTNLWLVIVTLATLGVCLAGGFVWLMPWVLGPALGAFLLPPTFKDTRALALCGMFCVGGCLAFAVTLTWDEEVTAERTVYVEALDHTVVIQSVQTSYMPNTQFVVYPGTPGARFWRPGDDAKRFEASDPADYAVGAHQGHLWAVTCDGELYGRHYDPVQEHWLTATFRASGAEEARAALCGRD